MPFAQAVYVGSDIAPQVYGPVQTNCPNNSPGCTNFTFNEEGGGSNDWMTLGLSTKCVVARTNSGKWNDSSPSTNPVDKAYLQSNGGCGLVDNVRSPRSTS